MLTYYLRFFHCAEVAVLLFKIKLKKKKENCLILGLPFEPKLFLRGKVCRAVYMFSRMQTPSSEPVLPPHFARAAANLWR